MVRSNHVAQVIEILGKKLALIQFDGSHGLIKLSHYEPNLLEVVLGRLRKDDDVIQVCQRGLPAHRNKHHIHLSLKSYGAFFSPNGILVNLYRS